MKLPIQSAPVQRDITGVTLSSENGVDASFWGAILKGIATVAPHIINAIAGS